MKIRNGFVSNSSSTSFCIFGISVSDIDAYEVVKEWNGRAPETKLTYERGCENYYDEELIGVEPEAIKNDETFAQFRERVAKTIAEATGMDPASFVPTYCIDGGYEG